MSQFLSWKSSSLHCSSLHLLTNSLSNGNLMVLLSDLKSGKCSSVVEARLLQYWEARNVKRGGELMWVDMIMVDANATIGANRRPKFRERLAAGSMYSIYGF
ncbi:hypothetical protein N665_0327s0013 [Sinapis alba]|nr:hypothetical protein N665_0327s0013 [Sinapis alba]